MLALLFAAADAVKVIVKEPRPASPWVQTFTASCGEQTLEVKRSLRPLNKQAEVVLNGKHVGGAAATLERDLSIAGAAYRMSLECQQDGDGMYFRWVRGLAGGEVGDKPITYSVGSAAFAGGKLIDVRSTQDVDAENFWYR